MTDWLMQLPTWVITRVAGLSAFYLLTIGVVSGIFCGSPGIKGVWKARIFRFHSWTQGFGLIVAIAHVIVLAIDRYAKFDWITLIIPFSAPQHRLEYGLGSLAMYGLLAILLTSDFRGLLANRIWKTIHMTAYPVFFLALIHGLFSGTDSAKPLVFWSYAAGPARRSSHRHSGVNRNE
ncbi:ferric reductase-like transmembrane domain-containing protein [Cohnella faecalis]|uniref:Uncharacterized protein n=1 Tax=Cohnella faecalis TaxID=2315694 RepID=A0A398CMQ3_9BACL|nr:ferric reductase-like transmembrane domain-containing protein [Cohnella faecalis]RIE00871.1 hypothetical protein D3H35_26015 [Cohnella faecalis]